MSRKDITPKTEEEASAREIVKTMLPVFWRLENEFAYCFEWEDLKDAGAWGAALYEMGDAIYHAIDAIQIDGSMEAASDLFEADEEAKEAAQRARRRARREAAKSAKANG